MKPFACYVYLPAIVLLGVLGWRHRRSLPAQWIIYGTIGGIVAAVAYDLFRLPFVLGGAPLFKPFAGFGELLLGQSEPRWLIQSVGWSYHFSNGAALELCFGDLVEADGQSPILGSCGVGFDGRGAAAHDALHELLRHTV